MKKHHRFIAFILTSYWFCLGLGFPQDKPAGEPYEERYIVWEHAIRQKNLGKIKQLFDSKANPNVRNPENGQTPLHVAIAANRDDIAKLMIERGADVNALSNSKQTPLHMAASAGKEELISLLLAKGANIDAKTNSGSTPVDHARDQKTKEFLLSKGGKVTLSPEEVSRQLFDAVKKGDANKVKEALAQGADPNRWNSTQWPPIVLAAERGHLEVVKVLLEQRAQIEAASGLGWTALMQAAANNRLEVLKFLLSKGANTSASIHEANPDEASDKEGYTALDFARERKFPQIVQILQNSKSQSMDAAPVVQFILSGQYEETKKMLDGGIDANAKDREGRTLLFVAAKYSRLREATLLIGKGCNVNLLDNNGCSALFEAVGAGASDEMIKLLLDHGAKVDIRDNFGKTLLQRAQSLGMPDRRLKIIELLRAAGAKE